MPETVIVALIMAGGGIVGGVIVGYIGRARVDKRNNKSSHDSYLESDRAAATSSTRDVKDLRGEMCGFHEKLKESFGTQETLLRGIKGALDNIVENGVKQRQ